MIAWHHLRQSITIDFCRIKDWIYFLDLYLDTKTNYNGFHLRNKWLIKITMYLSSVCIHLVIYTFFLIFTFIAYKNKYILFELVIRYQHLHVLYYLTNYDKNIFLLFEFKFNELGLPCFCFQNAYYFPHVGSFHASVDHFRHFGWTEDYLGPH